MRPELILSIIAILVSVGSLSWTIVSWRRTGPVIKVTANALVLVGGVGPTRMVGVTASNLGRSPVRINNWGFLLPDGNALMVPAQLRVSAPLPHRVEAHDEATWFVETELLTEACESAGFSPSQLRAFVVLPGERKVRARKKIVGVKAD